MSSGVSTVSGVDADELLEGLNRAQRAAVTATSSPLCILAGAGSGKTRVLTRRIAWRAATGDLDPRHVLALTFTLLNCLKPLHVDDSGFYCFASHIADAPLSPYGFEFLWGPRLWSALQGLAPPVLPPRPRCSNQVCAALDAASKRWWSGRAPKSPSDS